MPRPRAVLFLRIAALLALGVSSALLLDYLNATPSFCRAGSGCERVREAAGYVGPVPIPAIGLASFVGLFGLSLADTERARRLTGWAALFGAFVAVGLVATQVFVIGSTCSLCLLVDGSAVGAGIAGAFLLRSSSDREEPLPALCWVSLAFLAMGLPVGIVYANPAPAVPGPVAALARPGTVSIVEFSDFECPHCRAAHPAIEAALHQVKVPVSFVRKTFPLPSHKNARPASRAWVCATAQGKGNEMADLLFSEKNIGAEACEALASRLSLDLGRFRECVADPSTEARIEADMAFVRSSGFEGVPTVWIGETKLLGPRPTSEYVSVIERSGRGERPSRTWWPLASVLFLVLFLFGWGWSSRPEAAPVAPAPPPA